MRLVLAVAVFSCCPRCGAPSLVAPQIKFHGEDATACEALVRDFGGRGLWEELRDALSEAAKPAVMIFTNAAHYVLVHNFLCSSKSTVLPHVVLWCADDVSLAAARHDWAEAGVRLVRLGLANVSLDAPFKEAGYARFAAIKALMPRAAQMLGFDALTQDADVVWRSDVLDILSERSRDTAAMMADSNRVDTRLRPCKPKEREKIRAYDSSQNAEEACANYRCVSSVNGGFLWLPSNATVGSLVAKDWFAMCPDIMSTRENQPSLVAALERRVKPGRCVYDREFEEDVGGPPLSRRDSDILILNANTFASGQRPAYARQTDNEQRLAAFHCNFRFGWRAKCQTLRFMDLLFIEGPDHNSSTNDVCKGSHQPRCTDGYCTGGPCKRRRSSPQRN